MTLWQAGKTPSSKKKIKRTGDPGGDWRVRIDSEGHEGTVWNDGHTGENLI